MELPDTDDGNWKKGVEVPLLRQPSKGWTLEQGVLASAGKAANYLSEERFQNFDLHAEYRLPRHANSGISLRGRYELQLLGDYGEPPEVHGNAAIYSRIAPSVNASRPGGQWQTLDVRLIGRQVTVVLNGVTVIHRRRIDGPCGLSLDAHEDQPGPIVLQGDHGPVEFRNVRVVRLERAAQ